MSDRYVSRKGLRSEIYPKSSGQNATDEGQIPLPWKWWKSADKKTIHICLKEGYQLDLPYGDESVCTSIMTVMADVAWPVGSIYQQLPEQDDPNALGLPGTWDNISSEYAGDFFRVEGGDALAYDGGQQLDQMQRLTGTFNFGAYGVYTTGTPNGVFTACYNVSHRPALPLNAGAKGLKFDSIDSPNSRISSTTDGETRPVNQTIRVWKRIS